MPFHPLSCFVFFLRLCISGAGGWENDLRDNQVANSFAMANPGVLPRVDFLSPPPTKNSRIKKQGGNVVLPRSHSSRVLSSFRFIFDTSLASSLRRDP